MHADLDLDEVKSWKRYETYRQNIKHEELCYVYPSQPYSMAQWKW